MKLVKVAAAPLNQTPLDWDGNKRRIERAIATAREAQVSILCLPELCITGYGCEDAFHSPGLHEKARQLLTEIVPNTRGLIVALGLPMFHRNGLFDTACLAVDGQIAGFVGKRFLAGDGIHYEPRWFRPWPRGLRTKVEIGGRTYPLGDYYFDCGGVRIGFEICEDAWVADRPAIELAADGVDLVLNPSASHFAFGKTEVRRRFVLEGSRTLGLSYVYANLLGNEAGRAIYDGDALIASAGQLLAEGRRFSFADERLTVAQIDVDATRMNRSRAAGSEPEISATGEGRAVEVAFQYPVAEPEIFPRESEAWETSHDRKQEEFTRAVGLALFDYMRKSRSRGFIVSLSGGADSSAVACLIGLMVQLGTAELGLDGFLAKLSHCPVLRDARNVRDIVRGLLICVYQSTRNSSDTTRNAARTVAEAVGAEFLEWDVDELVEQYVSIVSRAIDRKLDWERDDLALQNIQARARAPGVWLLANLRGALLLTTSNRSEMAVGYATMDGDTAGGLCPLAGIDKAFLLSWLTWLEVRGVAGIGPMTELSAVTRQAPTAELRPPGEGQTDEADLMPYPVLDAIERAAIRDKHTPLEAFLEMRSQFPAHEPRQLAGWVERFFRLWCRNQWKRERYAPSFHLDDENLDPKTWCRFPILSGGYERELAELAAYVAEHY